jgi:hypothetical protein
MYPTVLSGALASRRKLRLCKDHFQGYLDQLNIHANEAGAPPNDLVEGRCYLCSQTCDHSTSALYVTAYNVASDREDWYAPLHDNCVTGAAADWGLEPEMA